MVYYESTFICSPLLPPEKIDEVIERIKKLLSQEKAEISVFQKIGLKKLAYPIKHHREGYYVYLEFSGPAQTANKLRNFFQVTDGIIRYLTVRAEKKSLPEKLEEVKTNGNT